MSKTILTPERIAEALERIGAGESIPQIAKSFNMERSSLYRMFRRRRVGLLRHCWGVTLRIPDSATDLAYIAGIIDGEGSIYFASRSWHLKIGMTDEPIIRWLASFGGVFQLRLRRAPLKTVYSWTVSRRMDIIALLTAVLPYLRVKRERAEDALRQLKAVGHVDLAS